MSAVDRSNLNRMIRIYDYLRYGQKKDPVIQASASRHHHGDLDDADTGSAANVNKHQHKDTINLY